MTCAIMMNGSAIRTGACLLWSVNPRGRRIDLARQFALRLQLSANTHDMPEVRPVRPKKRSALIKPSLLLEATSHTAMGIAVGLAFAFLATHITALGIATLINYSPTPDVVMIMFVGTCAITFGIGATLTGLAITLTEDTDTTGREALAVSVSRRPTRTRSFRFTSIRPRTRWLHRLDCRSSDAKNLIRPAVYPSASHRS